MKKIIIIGADEDPHIIRVFNILKKYGNFTFIFDPQNIEYFACDIKNGYIELQNHSNKFFFESYSEFAQFARLWDRNKRVIYRIGTQADQARFFKISEAMNFIHGLILASSAWHFNNITCSWIHGKKIHQMRTAHQFHNCVPATIVSNNKNAILDFLEENNNCIVKPLKTSNIPEAIDDNAPERAILTNRTSAAEIHEASDESICWSPMIVQKEISKMYELRVVVVAVSCFFYKIDSQSSYLGQLDWRRAQYENIFTRINPIQEIKEFCFNYLKKFGLLSGSFDFIIDDQCQDFWFLECNSAGQWAWLEDDEDQEISSAVAELLLGQNQ